MTDTQSVPIETDKYGTITVSKDGVDAQIVPASLPAFLRTGWTGTDAEGNAFPELKSKVVDRSGDLVAVEPPSEVAEGEKSVQTVTLGVSEDEPDERIYVPAASAAAFARNGWNVDADVSTEAVEPSQPKNTIKVTRGTGEEQTVGYIAPASLKAFTRNGWTVEKSKDNAPAPGDAEVEAAEPAAAEEPVKKTTRKTAAAKDDEK